MKVAVLQPKGIVFQEVSIQVNLDENENPVETNNFDFAGVQISCEVGYADPDNENNVDNKASMLVSIALTIANQEGKKAPYNVKVAATGIFAWLDKKTPDHERRDLTVVNGASILYGSIREMVLNVTSRSLSGSLLLPSFNFIDHKPSITESQQAEKSD
ncbi:MULTISPECIES: protein-export chaperone SecB [unclassified Janthinobacterium]|uniref:protein-export chaperone SecB n=1 Tax=unclassified Janthinobacterium TaxID=2610881 RepID=UPI000C16DB44|nr:MULTISPECIES: protein-export chaperone SecB [unclassified Janthinobacterium]MBW3513006.1 protein-export chaperone SecB [Janthinobacterium sp. NKUCC06_STL]PIF09460.1 preprotein translocase subunit SecB [Janthinobacterium sp. 13]